MIIKPFIILMILLNSLHTPIKDYSYFLFSLRGDNEIDQGTGFFIEKNNEIYLVTASHNFFKDKFATEKTADFFYIRLNNQVTNKTDFLRIENDPISKSEKYRNLDINFYKLNLPQEYKLNIIKIDPHCQPSRIICHGFGVKNENDDNFNLYLTSLEPTEFKGNLKFDYNKPLRYF